MLPHTINEEGIEDIYLSEHPSEHPSPTVNKEAEEGNNLDWNLYPGNEAGAFDHLDQNEDKPINNSVGFPDKWEILGETDIVTGGKYVALCSCGKVNPSDEERETNKANAKRIITAVNNHSAMLRALKELVEWRQSHEIVTHSANTIFDKTEALINSIEGK